MSERPVAHTQSAAAPTVFNFSQSDFWPAWRSVTSGLTYVPTISVPSFVIDEQLRKLLFQQFDLWTITNLNVRIVRVMERVILVIVFSPVEALQRRYFSDDPFRKHLRLVELRDI